MKKTTILMLFCFGWVLLPGQDLIERTKAKQGVKKTVKANRISQNLQAYSKFEKLDIFALSKDNGRLKSSDRVVILDLDEDFHQQFSGKNSLDLSIPVTEETRVNTRLYRVRSSSASFIVRDQNGTPLLQNRGTQFFRGTLADDPGSLVALTVFEESVVMVISDSEGNYNLGKLKSEDRYAFFNENDASTFQFDCMVSEANSLMAPDGPGENEKQSKSNNGECVKVYVEADYETYSNMGFSDTQVTDFIEGTFNVVATLYDNESIPIELSELTIWHNPDPYNAENDVFGALMYLNANINSFNGDLFHLVSAIGNIGSFSGIANVYCNDGSCNLTKITALCKADPFAVSQTQLYYEELPTYSWTVNVFAHEMGHNMGSPHTHACQWGPGQNQAIDGCATPSGCGNPGLPPVGGGTIMSYCHINSNVGITLTNGFGQEVGDHIRSQYNSVSCLTECSGGGPSCEETIMVNASPVQGVFEASDHIGTETGLRVTSGASFNAPNVEINIDFTVEATAIFDIMTVGCNQ